MHGETIKFVRNSVWTVQPIDLPAQQNSHTFTRSCFQTHDGNIKTRRIHGVSHVVLSSGK